jgi:hypothetical protein
MEMESTILHELNHAYEGLKRGNKNKIVTSLTWSLDVNATKVPDEVWSRWYDAKDGIGYNLYWAEDHETNAMIQDSYPYTKRYSVGEMKKHTPSWEYANRMLSFNAKKFKQSMIDVIQNHMKEDPNVVLDKMKNGLADTIDSNMKKWKEKTISISGESIRKMSVDQFLEYCEKKIHKSANRLKRGILRHYSK